MSHNQIITVVSMFQRNPLQQHLAEYTPKLAQPGIRSRRDQCDLHFLQARQRRLLDPVEIRPSRQFRQVPELTGRQIHIVNNSLKFLWLQQEQSVRSKIP